MNELNDELIIVGAGGFSRELLAYVADEGRFQVKGLIDDAPPTNLRIPEGIRYLGTISDYQPGTGEAFLMAIGEPTLRAKIAKGLIDKGARFQTIIHPRAYVAASAEIGAGSVVAPFASVGASARLGELVQVHFYASVAHDAVIGAYSALSPYSAVNGGGQLGEGVFMGTRATVNPLKKVGNHSKVAAGAVVYQDVPSGSLAAGNPAKARRLMSVPD